MFYKKKLNLIEVRRKLNKEHMRFDKKNVVYRKLYKVHKQKKKAREVIEQQKRDEEQKETYSFNPVICNKSKHIMEKKEKKN